MAPRKVCIAILLIALAGVSTVAIHNVTSYGDGECGPTSLYALSVQLGSRLPYAEILKTFPGRHDEVSFTDIQTAAATFGLPLDGEQLSVADLRQRRILGILHVDRVHFVAIVGFGRNGVRIANPISPGKTVTSVWAYSDLDRHWDGRILVVRQSNIKAQLGH